jgi:hypothetical protein
MQHHLNYLLNYDEREILMRKKDFNLLFKRQIVGGADHRQDFELELRWLYSSSQARVAWATCCLFRRAIPWASTL